MSDYLVERILKPKYFRIAHLRQGRGNRSRIVLGFDSESHSCTLLGHRRCDENGFPFLYQFAWPDGRCDLVGVPRTGRSNETLFTYLDYLRANCTRKDVEYLVYGFNLEYEFTQLFRDVTVADQPMFALGYREDNVPSLIWGDKLKPFYLRAMNDKRYTFTIEWANTKRFVRVLDAMAYIPTSLDGAAKMLGIGRKEEKPHELSREAWERRDPDLIEYASQDAILTQRLGQWVTDMHDRYDVTQTMSAPHFASKVYKRAFLRERIPLPDSELEQAGLHAYHGGKNGYYRDRPVLVKNVWHVDITSAYPEAMHQLPDPEKSEWLYHDRYVPGSHAVWRVKGTLRRCTYKSLMTDKAWGESGDFVGTVTGYELDTAIALGEFTLKSCDGWVMTGPPGGSLVDFVDTFFAMKKEAKSPSERAVAKLFLNSLYGKFFQKVPNGIVGAVDLDSGEIIKTDPSQAFDHTAGGLYHPPIAALITGFVRAKIHRLEHECESVMTSTDGFFSLRAPDPGSLGKSLGMLTAERGTLRIWRERVYVFDPDKPEHAADCKPGCRKKHPIWASHAYRGGLDALRRMPMTAGNLHHYQTQQMVTIKMSRHLIGGASYRPGEFITVDRSVQMPGPAP